MFFDISHADLTIADTTPPVLTVPGPIVVNAKCPPARVVNFTATATDNIDPTPTVVCVPPSGSMFPIGDDDRHLHRDGRQPATRRPPPSRST